MGLVVFDSSDVRRFEYSVNGFSSDTRVSLASASKMVSTATIFEAVRQGSLTLDSTTSAVLGWSGDAGAITLRHLLSFTSGLDIEAGCTLRANTTLEQCAADIGAAPLVAPPGTRFDYGSTHLTVAGRMVEVATGQKWNDFFEAKVRVPLGLPLGVTYFTAPRSMVGRDNPLLAGGLRASMNEYAKILAVIFHKGQTSRLTLGTPALFDAQAIEPFPNVVVGLSPAQRIGFNFRYGLGAWLECNTPATGCQTIASAGAFGFTPWVARGKGYYAILGMEQPDPGSGAYSIPLEQALQPLIEAALMQ